MISYKTDHSIKVLVPDCECGIANSCIVANRIVNGETAQKNEYPWQVGLVQRDDPNKVFCGATIINKRYLFSINRSFNFTN